MSTEQIRTDTGTAHRGGGLTVKSVFVAAMVCALIALAGFFAPAELMIATCGMVPTMVAAFVDHTPRRLITQCVGAMNFAGVSAVMALAWNDGGTIGAAVTLLTDPYSWLVMLVGAAVGWSLSWAGRVAAARIVAHLVDRQVQQLRDYQTKFVAEWGRRVLEKN